MPSSPIRRSDSARCERRLAGAALSLLLTLPLPAEILGARLLPAAAPSVAPIAPPAPPPAPPRPLPAPPTQTVPRTDTDSGGRWLRAEFPHLTLLLDDERLEHWSRLPTGRRLPLEWVHRWTPGVHFGVGEARREVLPSLDGADWLAYRAHLRRFLGPRARFTVDDDSAANTDLARVLGQRTRVLAFDLAPPEPDRPPIHVVEVAVELGGAVLLFRLDGPAPNVAAELRAFERLIIRAERE